MRLGVRVRGGAGVEAKVRVGVRFRVGGGGVRVSRRARVGLRAGPPSFPSAPPSLTSG